MDLVQDIENYLQRRADKDRNMEKIHLSELGYGKQRLLDRFKENGKREKPKPQLQRIFDNGHFVHDRYYKYFSEMGILRAVEIQAVDDDVFSGTADCIISDKDGLPWLVDIKSCNSWVFKKLQDMKKEHRIQILAYMYFMNIDRGIILYENKDDQNIKIFDIYMNEENKKEIERIINEFRDLMRQMKEEIQIYDSDIDVTLNIEANVEDLYAI